MKWPIRIIVALVLLTVVAVVALQVVLQKNLKTVLDRKVIPHAEAALGVDINIDAASVSLLGGAMAVEGVRVGNPVGFGDGPLFSMAASEFDVGMKALVRGGVADVHVFSIDDARLAIVRGADERLNVKVVADTFTDGRKQAPTETAPETPAPPAEPSPGESGPLPALLVREGRVSTSVRYTDYALGDEPFTLELALGLTTENLRTAAADNGSSGTIGISGGLATDANIFATELKGEIAPYESVQDLSFTLSGDVLNIDMDLIRPQLHDIEADCAAMSLKIDLVCKNGEFDPKQSVLSFKLEEFELVGDAQATFPGGSKTLPQLVVPMPLKGTITKPRLGDFKTALLAALTENIGVNLSILGKSALEKALEKDRQDEAEGKTDDDSDTDKLLRDVRKGLGGLLGVGGGSSTPPPAPPFAPNREADAIESDLP